MSRWILAPGLSCAACATPVSDTAGDIAGDTGTWTATSTTTIGTTTDATTPTSSPTTVPTPTDLFEPDPLASDVRDTLYGLHLYEVELTIAETVLEGLATEPEEYAPAQMHFVNHYEGPVELRLKGDATFRPITEKSSFKVKVDGDFPGGDRLQFHNNILDPTMMRETLTHEAFRALGHAAPRTAYAWVTVNGHPYGLYTMSEPDDDEYAEKFAPSGALAEGERCDVNTCECLDLEEGDAHWSLEALCDTAQAADTWSDLTASIDEAPFVAHLAAERALGHWDGYALNLNNFHLLQSADTGKWRLGARSGDLGFGWYPLTQEPVCISESLTDPDAYTRGLAAELCVEDPSCAARLAAEEERIAERWHGLALIEHLDALEALVRDAVEADPRKEYGMADFDEHVACLRIAFEH